MCGIVAIVGDTDGAFMRQAMARIKHRGPDGEGIFCVEDMLLGHVRLAIVDVGGGGQPMTDESGTLAVAFNGEIYNHLDLRSRIERHHRFRTRSDTEVLLHLYEEKAEDMLPMLDGMFGIAMTGPGGLLLARDPIGIKPLYYGRKAGLFMAASELKAFPPMDEIHALPAGHAMIAGGEPWRYAPPLEPKPYLLREPVEVILEEIRRRLENAVVKRLMGDVPVGVFLSGGLDSSVVAALMRPHTVQLHSFAAGVAGAPDLAAARQVAKYLETEHHEVVYTPEDVEKALPEVIRYLESFDGPLVRSAVPGYFVARLAAEHVKVALTGEGADELFAGYSYLREFGGGVELKRELLAITERLQDTNLQRTDRMTMAHGLEGRVPFLDMDLVRYASRLPPELLEHRPDRPEKWLLREACKGLLPATILNRKKLKFSEGAGSSDVIAEKVSRIISPETFDQERIVAPGVVLRSPEELSYFRIWRDVMGPHLPPGVVGRTRDASAAT